MIWLLKVEVPVVSDEVQCSKSTWSSWMYYSVWFEKLSLKRAHDGLGQGHPLKHYSMLNPRPLTEM